MDMKDKFTRYAGLLRAELSTAKGLLTFLLMAAVGTMLFLAMFVGGLALLAGYVATQAPAAQLAKFEALTIAQVVPHLQPFLHEFLLHAVGLSVVISVLFEIGRSIRVQERKLAAA
jgi:hypothetical protein